jgi:hypothetical protein
MVVAPLKNQPEAQTRAQLLARLAFRGGGITWRSDLVVPSIVCDAVQSAGRRRGRVAVSQRGRGSWSVDGNPGIGSKQLKIAGRNAVRKRWLPRAYLVAITLPVSEGS